MCLKHKTISARKGILAYNVFVVRYVFEIEVFLLRPRLPGVYITQTLYRPYSFIIEALGVLYFCSTLRNSHLFRFIIMRFNRWPLKSPS